MLLRLRSYLKKTRCKINELIGSRREKNCDHNMQLYADHIMWPTWLKFADQFGGLRNPKEWKISIRSCSFSSHSWPGSTGEGSACLNPRRSCNPTHRLQQTTLMIQQKLKSITASPSPASENVHIVGQVLNKSHTISSTAFQRLEAGTKFGLDTGGPGIRKPRQAVKVRDTNDRRKSNDRRSRVQGSTRLCKDVK